MPCAAHSPAYESFAVEGHKIRLHFKYAEGLRVRGGGEVIGFAIRGATGKWLWAKGRVDGQDLLVWNDQISNPTEVHYAWSMNPLISMENGAGLPMRPFSTTRIKP
jgi:sialate O-acetylesterase